MANAYSVLSISSVATVLVVGNVQAQSIPPEGPVCVISTAATIPAPANCGDQFDLSAFCRVLYCRTGRT
jgi:hypothetical protein